MKFRRKFASFGAFSILIALVPSFASAGTGSHGGKGFICHEKFLGRVLGEIGFPGHGFDVHLADAYLAGEPDTDVNVENMSEGKIIELALGALRKTDEALANRLQTDLGQFQWVYVRDLPDLDDDDIRPEEIPQGCRKVQLAIQDMQTGVIQVKQDLYSRLSHLDRALLRLHEAFVKEDLPLDARIQDTRLVRESVSRLANSPETSEYFSRGHWCIYNPVDYFTYSAFEHRMSGGNRETRFSEGASLTMQNFGINASACHEALSSCDIDVQSEVLGYLNTMAFSMAGYRENIGDSEAASRMSRIIGDPNATLADVARAADEIWVPHPEQEAMKVKCFEP